jgi:predicted RecB family endonuclease
MKIITVSTEAFAAMAGAMRQIAAAVAMVASQCQENKSEMWELRAFILSREKQHDDRVSSSVQNLVSNVHVPVPQRVAPHTSVLMPGISPLLPTLTNLRADAQLVNQAERLVDNMAGSLAGNHFELSGSLKPGLLRQGGEQAPKVKILWPHDLVMG